MEILVFLLDGIIGWCVMRVGNWFALEDFRRARNAHWTERARVLWPVRRGAYASQYVIPAIVGLSQPALFGIPTWVNVLGCFTCFLGAVLGSIHVDRLTNQSLEWREWLTVNLPTRMFYFLFGATHIVALQLMPEQVGTDMLWVTLGFFVTLVLLFGIWRLLAVQVVQSLQLPDDRLRSILNEVASGMAQTSPVVYRLKSRAPQAHALPLQGELWVTDGLLSLCTDLEIAAIMRHEMAHLTETRATTALRIVGAVAFAPLIFIHPVEHWLGGGGTFLLVTPVWLIAILWQRMQKRREVRADNVAVESETERGLYAQALCKIYEHSLTPAVNASLGVSHLDLYDRMRSAGIEPDFARPERPHRISWGSVISWGVLCFAVILMLLSKHISESRPWFQEHLHKQDVDTTIVAPERKNFGASD